MPSNEVEQITTDPWGPSQSDGCNTLQVDCNHELAVRRSRAHDAHTKSRFKPRKAGNYRHGRNRTGCTRTLVPYGENTVKDWKNPSWWTWKDPRELSH